MRNAKGQEIPAEKYAELQEADKRLREKAAARRENNTKRTWYVDRDGEVTAMTGLRHSVQPVFREEKDGKIAPHYPPCLSI